MLPLYLETVIGPKSRQNLGTYFGHGDHQVTMWVIVQTLGLMVVPGMLLIFCICTVAQVSFSTVAERALLWHYPGLECTNIHFYFLKIMFTVNKSWAYRYEPDSLFTIANSIKTWLSEWFSEMETPLN